MWRRDLEKGGEELEALRGQIETLQRSGDAHLRKFRPDQERKRMSNRLATWKEEEQAYSNDVAAMSRLLPLGPSDFDPGKFKIEELIPRKSLGASNSIRDLQHYVTGPGPEGLVVAVDGSLDLEKRDRKSVV